MLRCLIPASLMLLRDDTFIAKIMNKLHSHTASVSCTQPSATTEHVPHSRLLPPDAHTHRAHSHSLGQSDGSTPLSISWAAGGGASLCKQREDAAPLIASSPPLLVCLYDAHSHSRNPPGPDGTNWSRTQARGETGPDWHCAHLQGAL